MADDDKKPTNLDTQIFHQLGKLGADQQAVLRDVAAVKEVVKEHSAEVVKKLDSHLVDDTTRFDKVESKFEKASDRIKILENWRWYVLGIAGALAFAGWFWGVLK